MQHSAAFTVHRLPINAARRVLNTMGTDGALALQYVSIEYGLEVHFVFASHPLTSHFSLNESALHSRCEMRSGQCPI